MPTHTKSDQDNTPEQYIRQMIENDAHSKWLGLEILDTGSGYCKLSYTLRKDMTNGFGFAHGGALFSASDSAFAFASNSYGNISVAMNVSIAYLKPGKEGDRLTVEAQEDYSGNRTGVYRVITVNQDDERICIFNGTVYRTGKPLLVTKTT